MSAAGKVKKEKKSVCIFAGGQSKKNCPPVKDANLPLCEKHKRELNKLTRCRIADHIRRNFMEKGDESIIFNQKNGDVYSLNSTGTFIFRELLAGKSFCEIIAKSREIFVLDDFSEIAGDYRRFIEMLQKAGLIEAAHEK